MPVLIIIDSYWKIINPKQSARWQHLSWLKVSTFLIENYFVRCKKTQQLIHKIGNGIWWVIEPKELKSIINDSRVTLQLESSLTILIFM
jgi:hypothetical protein